MLGLGRLKMNLRSMPWMVMREQERNRRWGRGVMSLVLLNLKGWTPLGRGAQKTPGISQLQPQQGTEMRDCPNSRGCWSHGSSHARSGRARGQVVPIRSRPHCSCETTSCGTLNCHHLLAPCLSIQTCTPLPSKGSISLLCYWKKTKADRQRQKLHGWLRTRYWTHLASIPHLEMGIMGVPVSGCRWEYSSF